MKIKVIAPFRDKHKYSTLYPVGAVIDVENCRAERIVKLGLGMNAEMCVEDVKSESHVSAIDEETPTIHDAIIPDYDSVNNDGTPTIDENVIIGKSGAYDSDVSGDSSDEHKRPYRSRKKASQV